MQRVTLIEIIMTLYLTIVYNSRLFFLGEGVVIMTVLYTKTRPLNFHNFLDINQVVALQLS